MHKNPYKHRLIAGSSKCSTKPLSKFTHKIKQGLQKYRETAYSRSGVNQMWILNNSKELLDNLKSPNFNLITNIKSFDFSTLYTTIPHHILKNRLATIIRNSFLHKNGNRRYKHLVLGREGPYFVKEHSYSRNKYTEEDIINMLNFLVDNIFVVFAGKVFQLIIGISMGTNCAPLLAVIFLYSYEAKRHILVRSCMSPIIWIAFLSLICAYDYILKIHIKDQYLLRPMKYLGDKLINCIMVIKRGWGLRFGSVTQRA